MNISEDEMDEIKKRIEARFKSDEYNNPTEGIVMPCCGEKYCFSYARMKYLPKNPKLFYRSNGEIDCDPFSRQPGFVDYNSTREAIRQAKAKGLDHVHWRTSIAVEQELIKDGYHVHNDWLDTISWKKDIKKTSTIFKNIFKSNSMELWEILVPAPDLHSNLRFFSYQHQDWANYIMSKTDGFTMKASDGEWKSEENMIPVRIACDAKIMHEIAEFTCKHFEQESVLYYKISDECFFFKKNTNG